MQVVLCGPGPAGLGAGAGWAACAGRGCSSGEARGSPPAAPWGAGGRLGARVLGKCRPGVCFPRFPTLPALTSPRLSGGPASEGCPRVVTG